MAVLLGHVRCNLLGLGVLGTGGTPSGPRNGTLQIPGCDRVLADTGWGG